MIFPVHMEFSAGSWAWIAALAAIAASVWHARKTRAGKGLLALRLLAAAAIILALLNPAVELRRGVLKKPQLLILIDTGHSMAAASGKKNSRLAQALNWLKENKSDIAGASQARFITLSDHAQDLDWSGLDSLGADEAAFDPASALPQVQGEISAEPNPPKRIWLISDGVADSPPPQDILSALGAPVDVLGVGQEPKGQGLSFMDVPPPDFAFLHEHLSIPFSIKTWGLSGKSVSVELLKEDDSGTGWTSEEKTVLTAPAEAENVSQKYFLSAGAGRNMMRPAPTDFAVLSSSLSAVATSLGSETFRLTAQVQGGAKVERRLKIQVIRQKYRIMFLSGRPSPEYSFLREFLKSDPNREVVSFVILRNPDNIVPIPENELSLIPFPEEEIFTKDISQFDLFIMENFSPARFNLPSSYLDSVRDYVSKGGALLIIGGENAFNAGGYRGTPLEDLLPANLSAVEPGATSNPDFLPGLYHAKPLDFSHPLVNLYGNAAQSQAAWQALPDLDGYARLDSVNPQTTVVAVNPEEKTASAEPLPVIAVRPYGRGKVMMITTDSTWRWRLGGAHSLATSDFYQRFWSRAVEYLSGSLDLSKVKFVPLAEPLSGQEPLDISLRVFDAQFRPAPNDQTEVSLTWTKPDKSRERLTPQAAADGLYRVSLTGIPAGNQNLSASVFFRGKPWGKDSLNFFWNPNSEVQPMDQTWLASAAKSGGGSYENLSHASAADLLSRLPKSEVEAETQDTLHPFAGPWFMALAAALFALEIFLRRMKGHA